ncbi:transposon Tf2-9 polyprotein [Trichonephila clavipes]|nr:transposon Tf2-9 polyprotein [Trichonephila clavipes]
MQEENCRNFNKKRKKAYQYEIGDIVAIQRTQFGTGLKLRPKFFGPYEVVKVKPKDRYDSLSVPSFLYVSDSPLVSMKKKGISTAADSVRSGWPLWNRLWSHPIESLNESTQSSRAGAADAM